MGVLKLDIFSEKRALGIEKIIGDFNGVREGGQKNRPGIGGDGANIRPEFKENIRTETQGQKAVNKDDGQRGVADAAVFFMFGVKVGIPVDNIKIQKEVRQKRQRQC